MFACCVYWNAAAASAIRPVSAGDDWEYAVRNWHLCPWLSGGAVVEQHVQNLDVANWLKGAAPVVAQGQAGRVAGQRSVPASEFDYQFVEYTFADGTKLMSQCRQLAGCWNNVSEHALGTDGHADISGGKIYDRWRRTWSGTHVQLAVAISRSSTTCSADCGAACSQSKGSTVLGAR